MDLYGNSASSEIGRKKVWMGITFVRGERHCLVGS